MSIQFFRCTGFRDKPKIVWSVLPGRVSIYTYHHNPFMMMVCPHCGAEMVAKWEDYEVKITAKDSYNREDGVKAVEMARLFHKDTDYDRVKEKIADEMSAILEPEHFRCLCCDSPLRYDVGYYLNNAREFLSHFYRSSKIDPHAAQYDAKKVFLYPNEQEVRRYEIRNSYRDWGPWAPGIYNFNRITVDFCEEQGIAGHSGGGDTEREYPLTVYCEDNRPESNSLYSYDLTLEQGFALMRRFRERLTEEERAARVREIVDAGTARGEAEDAPGDAASVGSDPERLKQYLLQMIRLETGTLALSERLRGLYFRQTELICLRRRLLNDKRVQQAAYEGAAAADEAAANLRALRENDGLWKEHYAKIMGKKEAFEIPPRPDRPSEPVLEKPNLFNRKRAEAENEKRKADYQALLRAWEEDCGRWAEEAELLRQARLTEEKDAEREAREAAAEEIRAAEEKLKAAEERLAAAKAVLAEKKQENEKGPGATLLDPEIGEAEAALRRFAEARARAEKLNVVLPRYRELAAYTSFRAYLDAGRCTALGGSGGAYSLYESEERGKLEVELGLEALSAATDRAVTALRQIGDEVDSIRDYEKRAAENSEVLAYLAAVTAHYADRNAELTDALARLNDLC